MKTTIKSVLVLVLSIVTFFSCSNKDDDNNPPIVRTELVGTWGGYLTDADDGDTYIDLTLNSDGTGTVEFFSETEVFNWGATSNMLTITNEEGDVDILAYTLTEDDSVLTLTDDEGDVSILYLYE